MSNKEDRKERRNERLKTVAKTATAVTGGILAFSNRRAIGSFITDVTGDIGQVTSRALSKNSSISRAASNAKIITSGALDSLGDSPSLSRVGQSLFDNNLQEQMRKSYETSVRSNIMRRDTLKKLPGDGTPTYASRYYKEFHKKSKDGFDSFEKAATQQVRQNKVLDNIKESEYLSSFGGEEIQNAITSFHGEQKGIFTTPEDHIETFMKRVSSDEYTFKPKFDTDGQKDVFQSRLLETLNKTKGADAELFKANMAEIQSRAEAMRGAASFEYIKAAKESTSRLGKSLKPKGFEPISVSQARGWDLETKRKHGLIITDMDEKGNEFTIDAAEEMAKFLSERKDDVHVKRLLSERTAKINQQPGRETELPFDLDDMILDPMMFNNPATGEIIDNRHLRESFTESMNTFQESFQVPFLNFNPLDLTPWEGFQASKRLEGIQVLNAGQVHGFVKDFDGQTFSTPARTMQQQAVKNPLSNSDNFYTGGSVYRYQEDGTAKLIDEGLYLSPSQYGPFSRMHRNMTNYTEHETLDERGFLKKLFDVGRQEGDSRMTVYKDAYKKLDDPEYGPNVMNELISSIQGKDADGQTDIAREAYDILYKGIEKNASPMTKEAAEVLAPHINKRFEGFKVNNEAFDFDRLSDDTYLKEAAAALYAQKEKGSGALFHKQTRRSAYRGSLEKKEMFLADDPAFQELTKWTEIYLESPTDFAATRTLSPQKDLPIDDLMVPITFLDKDQFVTGAEKLRRSFHQYGMRTLDADSTDFDVKFIKEGIRKRTSLDYLKEGLAENKISKKDFTNAQDLEVLSDLTSYRNITRDGAGKFEAKTFLEDLMVPIEDGPFAGAVQRTTLGTHVQEAIQRAQPKFGQAPAKQKKPLNNANFIIMRKSSIGNNVKDNLASTNQGYKDYVRDTAGKPFDLGATTDLFTKKAGPDALETLKETSRELFAGRYGFGENLDEVSTTSAILYGLTERLDNSLMNFGLGLSRDHLGNAAGVLGQQYMRRIALPIMAVMQASYFDDMTDNKVSHTAADAFVTTHETLASVKEVSGINRALKPWKDVLTSSGLDQVGDWMGVKQLDFITMGALTDFRSPEEVRDFYESGEVAVRKNKYWGVGSPTPWGGAGIEYYRPNWYRELKSDYKMTDTMYGSKEEYWKNHWMPTLTNPLAPVRHFLTDPYHYEDKHEEDRPYAITGGFSSIDNLPIIGPMIDGTVGRILKPRKDHKGLDKAHEEYIAAVNDYTAQQRSPVMEGGTYVGVSPTGDVTTYSKEGDTGSWEGGGSADNQLVGRQGPTYGGDAGHVDYGNIFKAVMAGGDTAGNYGSFGAGLPANQTADSTLGGSGLGSYNIADRNFELSAAGQGVESGTISSLQKLDNMHIDPNISNLERVDGVQGMLNEAFYSASEITGIYGFFTKWQAGYDEAWRGTTLASSSLMTSPNRALWDQNLGGFGGSLSEIGRRYAPRDMNKNYYSPIRNTMPEWLPGIEGFRDFLHGDPYIKVPKGEMRLPGKAYESLYKLHPDETGEYGIFDRFRILADVSPNSDQYKVAKNELSTLRETDRMTPEMEKEYDEIMEQVKSRNESTRMYDKKFTNKKIKRQTVTITEVLDANMFMTKEFDDPIKLAGISLTEKDNEDAIAFVSQYIKPGERVEIGYAEEPTARYNRDTYNTLSAVVYTNKNEEGRMWFDTNKGTPLNRLVANRNWQNDVKIKDDGSPAATEALYANDMVTVGKYTEMVTHDILPKLPFVGVLADKFLQVRTPIESYKRNMVYGSDFRPWEEPYKAWLKPMVETISSRTPLVAGAELAALGHLFSKTTKGKGVGRIAGFAIGAGAASIRVLSEEGNRMIKGEKRAWIPEEKQKERDINTHFDRLKYVKYRGLYEKTRLLAAQKEGVDVEEFFDSSKEKGRSNRNLKRYLENRKKTLSLSKKKGYGNQDEIKEKIDSLNTSLEKIDGEREAYDAGQYTSLAIMYRKEYETTLYAMDDASDRTGLMRALTQKEREYMPKFLEAASSKDRREILEHVPDDIRIILQNSWGMEADKKPNIDHYFKENYLPDENWAGWDASVNLDDIKIKVMQKEGLNTVNAGYWKDDQDRAERSGAKAVPLKSIGSRINVSRLEKVLSGSGLTDVDVTLTTTYGDGPGSVNTGINIMNDVHDEVLDTINEMSYNLF